MKMISVLLGFILIGIGCYELYKERANIRTKTTRNFCVIILIASMIMLGVITLFIPELSAYCSIVIGIKSFVYNYKDIKKKKYSKLTTAYVEQYDGYAPAIVFFLYGFMQIF